MDSRMPKKLILLVEDNPDDEFLTRDALRTGGVMHDVVVARDGVPAPTGHDKTSIVCFQREDKPGSLLAILQEFSARAINLTKLESRPRRGAPFEYVFYIDLDGSVEDEHVATALDEVKVHTSMLKVLGSYPASKGPV